MSYWYLGTPYTKYPDGIWKAYEHASRQAGVLVKAGIPVFCPIAHSHPIAIHGDIDPADHDIWLPADRPMMDGAKGLIVCKLPTWEISYGLQHEIEYFSGQGKPVVFMEPGRVPERVLRESGLGPSAAPRAPRPLLQQPSSMEPPLDLLLQQMGPQAQQYQGTERVT